MLAPGMLQWRPADQSFYQRDSTGWRRMLHEGTVTGFVPTSRLINTTSPLQGGGNLTADRTISILDAAADGATKGAASFTASDFNSSSGLISIDYTNGQAATGSTKGFLTAADWTTFNGKIGALNGLTGASQTFATGTSGTDFNISSSGTTHTFNLPAASAAAAGKVTTAAQIFAGDKTFTGKVYAPQLNANIPYANTTTTEVYVASNSVKDPTVRVFTFQNGNEAGLDTTGTIAFTRSNNNSISLTDPSNGYGYVLAGQSIGQLVGDGVLRDESISFGAVTTGNPYVKIGFYSESDWLNVASAQTSIRFATKGNATTLPTERMRITQDGRVGIGTTLPFAPLHAHGTNPLALTGLQAGASTDSILTIAAGIVRKIPFAAGGTGFWSVTGNSGTVASTNFIGTTDNVDLRFRTNNTDKVTITTGGNLGINSTGPTRKLVINDANTTGYTSTGAVSMPDGLFQSINNTANTNTTLSGLTFQSTNSSGNFQSGFIGVVSNSGAGAFAPEMVFGQRTGSATYAERMRITSAGAVGINETTPGAELDVKGTSAVTGSALRVRNSTPSTVFQVDNNGDVTLFNGVKLVSGSGSPEGVVTAPTGSMYLNTAGGTITTLYIKTSGAGSTGWTAK